MTTINPTPLEVRLAALGLSDLASEEGIGLPYPLPKPKILRALEVAATRLPDKAIEIFRLHRDIIEGKL